MCLIVFAYKAHPKYKLILAANRDEFYARPTTTAAWWDDEPDILAGRDLQAGGTWMGVHRSGRFAAVTNYRDIANIRNDAKSRGDLPVDFLKTNQSSLDYAELVSRNGADYNGFNLIVMDDEMAHVSNYEESPNGIKEGIYGLSNALLDTPWPKVEKAKGKFSELVKSEFTLQDLARVLRDEDVAGDADLPETGLPLEMERAVSAMCIRTPDYGTCCSTAITVDYAGSVEFLEKSYPVGNRRDEEVSYGFEIAK